MLLDVIVLFDGSDLSEWELVKGGVVEWIVKDGVLMVLLGKGDIKIKCDFCDV